MMTNEMIYKAEMNNLDTTIEALTKEEREEVRVSYKEELKKDYENETEILFFLAVDWNITIAVVKAIIKQAEKPIFFTFNYQYTNLIGQIKLTHIQKKEKRGNFLFPLCSIIVHFLMFSSNLNQFCGSFFFFPVSSNLSRSCYQFSD